MIIYAKKGRVRITVALFGGELDETGGEDGVRVSVAAHFAGRILERPCSGKIVGRDTASAQVYVIWIPLEEK